MRTILSFLKITLGVLHLDLSSDKLMLQIIEFFIPVCYIFFEKLDLLTCFKVIVGYV